jgi:perosamine synthetase
MKRYPWWMTVFSQNDKNSLINNLENNAFTFGQACSEFEIEFALKVGSKYAVVTNSGTSALAMALIALNIGPEDEVIVPALSWIATAQAVAFTGAKPIFCDVEESNPILDIERVSALITEKTKAVIPVHYNGRVVDTLKLKKLLNKKGIHLVEDVCKGMFSYNLDISEKFAGSFADIACFSLGMVSLVSGSYGGVCVTNNEELYEKLKIIRWHGVKFEESGKRWDEEYLYRSFNFKPSNLLISMALSQMSNLTDRINYTRDLYSEYKNVLNELDPNKISMVNVNIEKGETPLLMDVMSNSMVALRDYLNQEGIETFRFHPPMNTANYYGADRISFKNANRFADFAFHLPGGVFRDDLDNNYFNKLRLNLEKFFSKK